MTNEISMTERMSHRAVAVIGAGPAGIVCARWLMEYGYEPHLFEASGDLGGQWNAECETSATWQGMVTNTSRIMTAFSDLDHPTITPTYPSREMMHLYLREYAEKMGVAERIRYGAKIERLSRDDESWRLEWSQHNMQDENGSVAPRTAIFPRVVVATGRQVAPQMPAVEGLDSFTGCLGVHHTCDYRGSATYAGATVIVGGCSISALEIATDLANAGARVITAFRRQRYIIPKLQAGVPSEHVMFTRAAALVSESLPEVEAAEGLKRKILSVNGSPESWGALKPDQDIRKAGISQAQGFLPAVAEGRIRTAGWIERVNGNIVHFANGTEESADAILMGTGFRLCLPFLEDGLRSILQLDEQGLDLYAETFHPALPGLAFVGQFNLTGPYFPVLELQSRWLASQWAADGPDAVKMCKALSSGTYRPVRGASVPMHVMAILFARLADVEPNLDAWPEMRRALLFGPLSPASFRIVGPHAFADAPERTLEAAAAFGHILSGQMEGDELQLDRMLRPDI